MKNRSLLLILIMFFSLSTTNAQEKKKLIGDYLSIGGWMNIQYDYEQQLNNEGELVTDKNTFNVRRARLDFKGNINKNLEFRVQADMAGSPKLVDGFVKVKLTKYFNIQAGQFKIPFTFENPQSPLTLEGVEYAQVISKLSGYSDISGVTTYSGGRDVGLMIYGDLFHFEREGKEIPILTYKLGLFNGNGMNKTDANTLKDIAGSIEVCPGVKGLMFATSYYDGNYYLAQIVVYEADIRIPGGKLAGYGKVIIRLINDFSNAHDGSQYHAVDRQRNEPVICYFVICFDHFFRFFSVMFHITSFSCLQGLNILKLYRTTTYI